MDIKEAEIAEMLAKCLESPAYLESLTEENPGAAAEIRLLMKMVINVRDLTIEGPSAELIERLRNQLPHNQTLGDRKVSP